MFVNNISQTLWIYNSRIPRIKNAEFSGYYFYVNTNIYGDFQICISVTSSLFYSYYFGRCSSELAQHVPLVEGLLLILIGCMIFLSPFPDVTRMSMSTVFFLAQLDSGILCL